MVHTIYTIVYGLQFSVQISPRQLVTGAFYFSLRLPRVIGLFLDLVYYCDDGEWRTEYLCPPTLSGNAYLERFALPSIERTRDRATDRVLRLFESSCKQRNEQCTGGEGRSLMVFNLLSDYPKGLCQWLCACVYELRKGDGTVSICLA